MRKSLLMLAFVPAVALAQANPQQANPKAQAKAGTGQAGGPGSALDDPARFERIQKRIRLAATLGLSEAIDLDEKGAMRVRDIFVREGEKRVPLIRQIRDNMRIVRDAARGDQAAAGQVDVALGKLREARAQMQKLDEETFQQITSGLSPDKKARAAIFLARFRERARHFAMMGGPGRSGPGGPGRERGPGWGPGRGGMGPGMRGGPREGFGPSVNMTDRHASTFGESGEPALEDWMGEEE